MISLRRNQPGSRMLDPDIAVALDNFEHIVVVGSQLDGCGSLPYELKVLYGQRLTAGDRSHDEGG